MTRLIPPDDPRYFTLSCHKPYDKHIYKIWMQDGSSVHIEDWEATKRYWFNWSGMGNQSPLSHVEVLDIPKTNNSTKKGFL